MILQMMPLNTLTKKKINIFSSENYLTFRNVINNFYDCKYIEKLFHNEELEISFLIVLRNQYDLINSLYHHAYHHISEFLKIKNFKKLINKISDGVDMDFSNFPLRLFLDTYDFNLIDMKLKKLFKDIEIKVSFL